MHKIYCCLVFFVFLQGCATPVGNFKENDFVWKEGVINKTCDDIKIEIAEAFSSCSQILLKDVSSPGLINYVAYLNNVSSPTNWVFGLIKGKPENGQCNIKIGIQKKYEISVFGNDRRNRETWFEMINSHLHDC
jgi:hypothetical protein